MAFAATRMGLYVVLLSKVSQTEKEILHDLSSMWNLKKKNDTNELTYKIEIHRLRNDPCQGKR